MLALWIAWALVIGIVLWRWRLARNKQDSLRAELLQLRMALQTAHEKAETPPADISLLADVSFNALLLVDADRRVMALNREAYNLFNPGIDPIGESLIAATQHHQIDELADAALSGSDDLDRQITINNRLYHLRALTTIHPTGRQVAIALRDVSELQRLSRARRDMVANISHELRTPITSIRLLIDTLLSSGLDDKVQAPKLLDNIAAETNRLQQMAQELLDLSMIESGKAIVRMASVPIDNLLSEAVNRLNEQAQRKRQTISYSSDKDISVLADSEMVLRVLTNLLHNAIKFTHEEGHITLTCMPDEDNKESLRIIVTDDGPGITFADRERIFERFYRADRARGGPGTGLGLAIAKHIIEAHGGTIWVAERDITAPGAQFIFTLPLAERNPPSLSDEGGL